VPRTLAVRPADDRARPPKRAPQAANREAEDVLREHSELRAQ